MVRVYRKDLGFGQGTDGQNYYEVSEERAAELAKVGYTTNEQEANIGRGDVGGSIYTGTDSVEFYSDVDAAVSGVSDTVAGRSIGTGTALAKSLFSFFPQGIIDEYAKNWVQYGNEDIAIGLTRKSNVWESEFKYLKRDDGSLIMSELEALSVKASYKNTLSEFGVPIVAAFENQFEELIKNEVSPLEFDTRVNTVYENVIDDIPQVAELYSSQFGLSGVTPEIIFAGLLNPDIEDAILNDQIATIQLGAEKAASGFTTNFDRMEQLRKQGFTRQTARQIYQGANPVISGAAGTGRQLDISTLEDAAVGQAEALDELNKAISETVSESSVIAGARKKGDRITGLTAT